MDTEETQKMLQFILIQVNRGEDRHIITNIVMYNHHTSLDYTNGVMDMVYCLVGFLNRNRFNDR